jgi:hypothetical protein
VESVQKQIAKYIDNKGITIMHISQKTGITYELLRLSLKANRKMSADEFVNVCRCIGLELKDFDIDAEASIESR